MKKLILPILLVVIAGGGYFAYTQGLIPGLTSPEQEAASQLKADIEAMKGDKFGEAYKKMFMAIIPIEEMIPEGEQKEQAMHQFEQAFQGMNLSYDSIKTRTEPGKAIADLSNVVMSVDQSTIRTPEQQQAMAEIGASNPFLAAFTSGVTEYVVPKISVIKHTDSPNHYTIDSSGVNDMYVGKGAEKGKFLSFNFDSYITEFDLNENKGLKMLSVVAKNADFIEGRGNTSVAKVGLIEMSYTPQSPENGREVSSKLKYAINDITFGDMIKIMLGQIEPISIGFDVDYSGNDLIALAKKAQNPEELKKIDNVAGDVIVNDFYIKMGQAGLMGSGNVLFEAKKAEGAENPSEPVVSGNFKATLAGYQRLIDYLTKFFPVPPEEISKNIAFFKEVGEDKGEDIGFEIEFDAKSVKVNGKDEAQIMEIRNKHFPMVMGGEQGEFAPAGEPQAVEAQPIQ